MEDEIKFRENTDVTINTNPFGKYNDELVFVNDDGEEVCEYCGSTNFQQIPGFLNFMCECGSHW